MNTPTLDLFDSNNDDGKTINRVLIQARQNQTKGGPAETADLPIFAESRQEELEL